MIDDETYWLFFFYVTGTVTDGPELRVSTIKYEDRRFSPVDASGPTISSPSWSQTLSMKRQGPGGLSLRQNRTLQESLEQIQL